MTTYCHCYVPAGSIGITQDGSNLDPECWSSPELRTWKWFTHGDKCSLDLAEVHQLPSKVQQSLLKGPSIRSYARLLRCLWIKLEFMVNEEIGVLRVYLLPDDILRRRIDRSDMSLQRSRQTLIQSLDYSANVWLGNHNAFLPSSPTPYQQIDQIDDMSLLQMFNNIPSPSPNPSDIRDPDAQNGMYSLLESKVEGLKMYMYPYQRRSAALMLQKELQPGMVLDPRLLHVRDQLGNGWYMDAVAGTVLLEPRHYHGTSGGILAEEMGAGKTIICLALILASKGITSSAPELYGIGDPPIRQRLGSLADMAASTANRNAVALKPYFDAYASEMGYNFPNCPKVLERNPGYYFVPANQSPRRGSRSGMGLHLSPQKIYLSAISLVVVPNNLVIQWRLEIRKHTDGLKTLVLVKNDAVPEAEHILTYDIVLFSQSRFEKEAKISASTARSTLFSVHFKRCIVDEGHKLGNSRISSRSILLSGLDKLHCSSRWIVTGTPSHGLFGVDSKDTAGSPQVAELPTSLSTNEMEKKDLERLGAMAALYLKARPWANTCMEDGDTLAEWSTYLMLPKHKFKSQGRWDCLRSTLNSLIIRHRKKDIGDLLPPVKEKIVVLDGSYQDRLSMNIFSMMIIFNSIQSQRNDMDYFFHPKQKSSLLQIVHNLKQSSFFGGSFFTSAEIAKAVETAEEFLREKKVSISDGDEALLQSALQIGFLATNNSLRDLSNQYHEMPVCVEGFPVDAREAWSLGASSGEIVCTSASLLLSLQTLIYKTTGEPDKFNALLNGGLILEGAEAKNRLLQNQNHRDSFKKPQTLAGNTRLGDGSVQKARIHGVNNVKPMIKLSADTFSKSLEPVKITATISAKMSYLLDNIVKYQIEEKIIIFYENENIAWYLASMLDVRQIQHLIYAKGLTAERRAQYVQTFHHNPLFRVLLMDLSQAAFGLDMREASRIYFINPVLNPQIEAQAIGRVRRISQKKPVSVETLVLKDSIDEIILERKQHMTQAEHRQTKSILDIPSIYHWMKNASINPLPESSGDNISQMTLLDTPHHVFGRGFGRILHPDGGLFFDNHARRSPSNTNLSHSAVSGLKRSHEAVDGSSGSRDDLYLASETPNLAARPAQRVKFAAD